MYSIRNRDYDHPILISIIIIIIAIHCHLYCRRGSHFHQDHLEICAKWTKLIFISLED